HPIFGSVFTYINYGSHDFYFLYKLGCFSIGGTDKYQSVG
ncbi:MAG: hypothetical protein ACI81W_002550, partial [Saprospiraceae bacterium]